MNFFCTVCNRSINIGPLSCTLGEAITVHANAHAGEAEPEAAARYVAALHKAITMMEY